MFTLKGRQDGFRLLLPDDFLIDEVNKKYTPILKQYHSFIAKPIDFLNETIQGVQVLGFQNGTVQQMQPQRGYPTIDQRRVAENDFLYPQSEYNYRAADSPINLLDKTINIMFRHTNGFLNYFIIYENFFYQFSRDMRYKNMPSQFDIEIYNSRGQVYAKLHLYDPIINSMDMLDLTFTQPVASSQNFQVTFKYSNFDFEFINVIDSMNN